MAAFRETMCTTTVRHAFPTESFLPPFSLVLFIAVHHFFFFTFDEASQLSHSMRMRKITILFYFLIPFFFLSFFFLSTFLAFPHVLRVSSPSIPSLLSHFFVCISESVHHSHQSLNHTFTPPPPPPMILWWWDDDDDDTVGIPLPEGEASWTDQDRSLPADVSEIRSGSEDGGSETHPHEGTSPATATRIHRSLRT